MKSTGFSLLIIAAVLIAPHVEWPEARFFAVICIGFGGLFLALEVFLK